MTSRHRIPFAAAAVAATFTMAGCGALQDVTRTGERAFFFGTADEARASSDSFRFQGFLPDDATDIRLIARLDGHASVMMWTSPTPFASAHCDEAEIASVPEVRADWVPDAVPTEGTVCGLWSVVRDGDEQFAWRNEPDTGGQAATRAFSSRTTSHAPASEFDSTTASTPLR